MLTNRILGRVTASQMASAAAISFLFVFTYGFTNRKRRLSTVWQILKFLREEWTPNMVDAIHEIINRSA